MSNRKNQPQKCIETQKSRSSNVSKGQWSNDQEECDIVVIKNLDPSTDTLEIKHGLEKLGFKVIDVRNAYNHSIGLALPVFFIKLLKNPKNVGIYDVKYVAHQVVVVEEYIHGPDPPRCTRCQELGHTRETCQKSPACAWCSGPHKTILCPSVNSSPPTCARCSKRHPASYKGCIVYKRLMAKRQPVREVIKSSEPTSHNMDKCSQEGKISPQDGKISPQNGNTSSQETEVSSEDKETCLVEIETSLQYKEKMPIEMKTNSGDRVTRLLERLEEALSSSCSPEEKQADSSELEEMNHPLNWTPPKEQLLCVENLQQEIIQHFLSMNKDLRVKLLISNGYSTSSCVTTTLEEAFAYML